MIVPVAAVQDKSAAVLDAAVTVRLVGAATAATTLIAKTSTFVLLGSVMLATVLVLFDGKRVAVDVERAGRLGRRSTCCDTRVVRATDSPAYPCGEAQSLML